MPLEHSPAFQARPFFAGLAFLLCQTVAFGQPTPAVSNDRHFPADDFAIRSELHEDQAATEREVELRLSIEQRFDDVSSRLESLEKQAASAPTEHKPNDGWIDVSNEKWTVKLGGHVQTDYINWAHADPGITGDQDYFEFRRLRLVADGTGYGVFDFRLQFTLEPEAVGESSGAATSPDVKDAYLSMTEIPVLGRLRIGNFFVPFSLEQVTNDTNNIFMERSIPSQGVFAADREVGIAFYNCTEDKNLAWRRHVLRQH